MFRQRSKLFTTFSIMLFVLFEVLFVVDPGKTVQATNLTPISVDRISGNDRYATAIKISQTGWTSANRVILASGEVFADALAGTVLTQAQVGSIPMLLNPSKVLDPRVLAEIQRLQVRQVTILGGTGAISAQIQADLEQVGLQVDRTFGATRYDTAAQIALKVGAKDQTAFLVNGEAFPDALSISSYATVQQIPILMTAKDSLPANTLNTLANLNVTTLYILGGNGVVSDSLMKQLTEAGYSVHRIGGADRYETNLKIRTAFPQNLSTVYISSGEAYADALTGSVLAAKSNNSLLLIPSKGISAASLAALNTLRSQGSNFVLLGGWGPLPYSAESMVRTGTIFSRFSLQYTHGSSYIGSLNQLKSLPVNATDVADGIAPSWFYLNDPPSGQSTADGSFTGVWDDTPANYTSLVAAAHQRGLKVLPFISSSWASTAGVDSVLSSPTARAKLIDQLVQRVNSTGVDGIVIDLEYMQSSTGPYLTEFMRVLTASLHAQSKLVIIAVMSRTSDTVYPQFNYHDLSQIVDFLHIMTYDYGMSRPAPIAPLFWMKQILDYTRSQGVDMHKVLLGIPYYGRDWKTLPPAKPDDPVQYSRSSLGYSGALDRASQYGATITRSPAGDPNGVPTFTYVDQDKAQHTVYFDDLASLEGKLALMDQYELGGIGAWSLYWVDPGLSSVLYPLLQRHLR
jgi:spore germination protein YaaH/putative cell wall-binding protein